MSDRNLDRNHIQVSIDPGKPVEISLKRFKRMCEAAGVLKEYKKRKEYRKPSVRKKEKEEQAEKRRIKESRKGRRRRKI